MIFPRSTTAHLGIIKAQIANDVTYVDIGKVEPGDGQISLIIRRKYCY